MYTLGSDLPWQEFPSCLLPWFWFQPFATVPETSGKRYYLELRGREGLDGDVRRPGETSRWLERPRLVAATLSRIHSTYLQGVAAALGAICRTLRIGPSQSWRTHLRRRVPWQDSGRCGGPQTRLLKPCYQTRQSRCCGRSLLCRFGSRFAWSLRSFLGLSSPAFQFLAPCFRVSISRRLQSFLLGFWVSSSLPWERGATGEHRGLLLCD